MIYINVEVLDNVIIKSHHQFKFENYINLPFSKYKL